MAKGLGLVSGKGGRYRDLTNERFGRLVAMKDVGRDQHKNRLWLCRCDCGSEKTVPSAYLMTGHSTSCGCLQREMAGASRFVDLSGRKFGRLTVVSKAGNSPHNKIMWNVKCDCGTEKAVIGASMTGGLTTSCGCHSREVRASSSRTHGMSNTVEFRAWASMIARCTCQSATGYENYGGRGISVCDRWASSFEAFYEDMGMKPSAQYSLDRYPDVDGNYQPGNVRWATVIDQARNKRSTFNITIGEDTKSLAEWCETLGLHYGTINSRIRKLGWQPEEALGFKERRAA